MTDPLTDPPAAAPSPRRRPKGDKRERTRARLLDAALDLTRANGFDRTTLQDIAEKAGMTTGAIYGNFRNRDELFMALAERQWGPIRPAFTPGDSFADLMAATAEAVIAALPDRRAAAVGALTFRAYALSHEAVRERFCDTMAAGYASGVDWFEAAFDKADLPLPPEVLVRVINSLIEGLTFQYFLTGELVTHDTIRAAFMALAGAPAARGSGAVGS